MNDLAQLLYFAELILSNPFQRDAPIPTEAEAELAAVRAESVEDLARRGHGKEARRIAVARALACESRRGSKVDGRGERVLRRLGLNPACVDRLVRGAIRARSALVDIAGTSDAMRRVRASAWRACFGESLYESLYLRPLIREQNVMVLGETGTGKELVARAIASADSGGEPPAVNAAAIPRELLESELFGHVKGAFTGAHCDRVGKIVAASGGTFFLDEIADFPDDLQAKLLRALEQDSVTPVGSNTAVEVDVRYVCATSQPLVERVDAGRFRVDLYQRLAGTVIEIPPLRERLEDLRPIADSIFRRYTAQVSAAMRDGEMDSTSHLSRLTAVQARFRAWLHENGNRRPWSGNVRELENLVREFVLGIVPDEAATPSAAIEQRSPPLHPDVVRFLRAEGTLRELEEWYIAYVFDRVEGRQRTAARILGIDRGTLARRLKRSA